MDQKDEELITEYQSGHKEAGNMICQRYQGKIFNFCYRILGNRADAEDATANAFLALFSRHYTNYPNAKFSTWLFTVARNSCMTQIRKRKTTISLWFTDKENGSFEPWEIRDSKETSREDLANREMAEHIRSAISQLPIDQREAIVLREYQKFSYEQIAQTLNCSLEKVKVLIFRAREQLRIKLSSLIREET